MRVQLRDSTRLHFVLREGAALPRCLGPCLPCPALAWVPACFIAFALAPYACALRGICRTASTLLAGTGIAADSLGCQECHTHTCVRTHIHTGTVHMHTCTRTTTCNAYTYAQTHTHSMQTGTKVLKARGPGNAAAPVAPAANCASTEGAGLGVRWYDPAKGSSRWGLCVFFVPSAFCCHLLSVYPYVHAPFCDHA